MKKTLCLVSGLILAILLVACGSGDNNNDVNDNNNMDNNMDNNNNTAVNTDAAEDLYKDNCASCHGDDLEGESGPELETIGNDMSEDEIREQIKNGADGMPEEILEGEEADQVSAWLADKK